MQRLFSCLLFTIISLSASAQDSVINVGAKVITLSEVVVSNKFNASSFVDYVKADTSYYKAFKNLRVLQYTAINDVRMLNSRGGLQASLNNTTHQLRSNGCRTMTTENEKVIGDFYNSDSSYNYYTAQMYASLFFTKGEICGETGIIEPLSLSGKSGMEKHKAQLKMLFFNPGRRISGIPFLSNKTAIYDDELAPYYDMSIDYDFYNGYNCYIFTQKAKPGEEKNVMLQEMTTWFDQETMQVVARNYHLKYNTLFYDFDVSMEVKMGRVGKLTVPVLIKYNGNWKAITKKRERGVFTAVLSDFKTAKD